MVTLEGSCHCGAVHFTVRSHTPQPYMHCYCSICRKTAGGGGYGAVDERAGELVERDRRLGYVTNPP